MALFSPAFSLADDARKLFGSVDEIPEQYFHMLLNVGRNYFASVYDFDPIDAAKAFPNATLQVLSGEGHMYSGEAVRQTIAAISDFFYTHLEKAATPQS